MAAATDPTGGPEPEKPSQAVERSLLDAARRHAELPVPGEGEPWTACAAADNLLVVGQTGELRACQFGACALGNGETSLTDAWRSPAFEHVRRELAAGRLPLAHCRRCAHWVADELLEQAPLLREYGGLVAAPDRDSPAVLVLELPTSRSAKPDWLAELPSLLGGLEVLVIAAASLDTTKAAKELFALLRAAESRPGVVLRLERPGEFGAAVEELAGVQIAHVELVVRSRDALDLDGARRLARELGAELRARFELTCERWFDYEDVARDCARHEVPLELRTLNLEGRVPLADLDPADLTLLRDAVISSWPRCGGRQRPTSLGEHALDLLCGELRSLLRRVTERALAEPGAASAAAAGDPAALGLPPPGHPWNTDPERQAWWWEWLFGHGHLRSVRDWLVATAIGDGGASMLHEHTWLRALAHRVALERGDPELLAVLKDLYGGPNSRRRLAEADATFAAGFDLAIFGGPWAERLGLSRTAPRKPPFTIGKAKAPPKTKKADVTVLIPSFKHGAYVEEAIRSVLAQRHRNLEVLVADDRSPDDTVERAKAIDDPRVRIQVNDENLGLGNSVLRALESIDTPYVALLNSDDLFHPDRLGHCLEVLEENAKIQLVTTGLSLVDSDGGELTPENVSLVLDGRQVHDWVHWHAEIPPPDDLPRRKVFPALLERNFLATSSNLVARTDWLRAQADALKSLKYCLDWQLFLEAALEDALHHVHEPLVAYRLHTANTVWFREGRRWSYYLEVNRVAANALRRFAERGKGRKEAEVARVLEAMTGHLAVNRETDGFAMFVNTALDSLQLERLAETSPRVQKLVQQLNETAERVRQARDAGPADGPDEKTGFYLRLLRRVDREQADIDNGTRRWLRRYADSLETRLGDCWAGRDRLEKTSQQAREQQERAQQRVRELDDKLKAAHADKERQRERIENLTSDLRLAREQASAVAELREFVEHELGAARRERDRISGELESLRQEGAAVRAEREAARAEADELRGEADALRKERDHLEGRRKHLRAALDRETAQVAALREAKNKVEDRRKQLSIESAKVREEMERLSTSREYRTGDIVWNRTGLAYVSRRGKKWYRRLRDLKNRAVMWTKGLFKGRPKADGGTEGVAVVAACWSWPIYSHTFVYQEMIGFTHMGLDIKMFHWDLGDTGQLHKAFTYLRDHRLQLEPVWENHKRDMEHFEKTKPGRLQAFLERVSKETGRPVDELMKESIVRQGCTFARMAELAGASYLHSYFFYDQSFMAMQAAWLLDLPRGVSCYADHMMDDYPFKLVPLHVELADVVVATSARIKRELSEMTGGDYDDKIIVKPNGVDGRRFPAIERPDRDPADTLDVISVSRIEPKKGLTYLVEAIAMLRDKGHRVIAHIIGSKDEHSKGSIEYFDDFERAIAEHGLGEQVILHGMMKQEDMAPLIEKSRAFVAPYVETSSGDKDGIPTAMLEALASALPVITTNAGSITEVIDDGVEGLVVAQEDAAAFAGALERFIRDPGLERAMARAARARFDQEFDINVTEKRLHERVAALVAARPQPQPQSPPQPPE